jgi:hypothetical protein
VDAAAPCFDRDVALAAIVDGYHRTVMTGRPPGDDDTSTHELKRRQDDRAREEERFAREADQPAEERAHARRADKAAYLRDKLAEAEAAERAAGADEEDEA